jgi:hypothetical protein
MKFQVVIAAAAPVVWFVAGFSPPAFVIFCAGWAGLVQGPAPANYDIHGPFKRKVPRP